MPPKNMRILFIHSHFPGGFRHLAAYMACMPGATVLFLAGKSPKDARLPKVRRLRVPQTEPVDTANPAEKTVVQALRNGEQTARQLLRLRREGFIPDIIYTNAADGYGFFVRDIFPEALLAVRADWFYTQGENHTFFTRGKARPPVDFAPARARNLCQYNLVGDCHLATTASAWQKNQYPRTLAEKITVMHDGVDTAFFSPGPPGAAAENGGEVVSFSCQGAHPARGGAIICRSLPRLLRLRPGCRVRVISFDGGDAPGLTHGAPAAIRVLEELIPPLSPEERERVQIVISPPLTEYRQMLRESSLYVYLTAPSTLSAGLFEAMSCGLPVVASDTSPVHDVVRHGENGFLCDFWNAEALADTVAGVLALSPRLMPLRRAARETVVREYDLQTQVRRQADMLLRGWEEMSRT